MAEQLIASMSGKWQPGDYKDEFRDRLMAVIQKRMKSKANIATVEQEDETVAEDTTTNVVDFMSLLKRSLASNKRTPAKKIGATRKAASKGGKATKKTSKAAKRSARRRASH